MNVVLTVMFTLMFALSISVGAASAATSRTHSSNPSPASFVGRYQYLQGDGSLSMGSAKIAATNRFVNQVSGKCMNVSGNNSDNGAAVIQWPCQDNGNRNDQFYFSDQRVANGLDWYRMRPAHSDKCLGIPGGSVDDGAPMIQWDCLEVADQFWHPTPLSGGRVAFLNGNSGKYVGVGASSLDDGAPVIQWNGSHDDQNWSVQVIG